jgi:transposase InsO family protein
LACDDDGEIMENYINYIVNGNIPLRVSKEDILRETLSDRTLSALTSMVRSSQYVDDVLVRPYKHVFHDLSISSEGFVLRNDRLVVPASLQPKMIDLAHEGHLGIVKTKQLLRSRLWFPGIDAMVERRTKSCLACQATTPGGHFTPLCMSELPKAPWSHLAVDFYGPIDNVYVLVVIDEYSRFPCAEIISSVSSAVVSKNLEIIFGLFGIPDVLKSDNGPPFQGREFKLFANQMGFKHQRITPLHPMANGLAESFMKNISNIVKRSKIEHKNWKDELAVFLRAYRSTPHLTTQATPMSLLFRSGASTCRLPEFRRQFVPSAIDLRAAVSDATRKAKMKTHRDADLHVRELDLKPGDQVLVQQNRSDKSVARFDHLPYVIVEIRNNMVIAQRGHHLITRNISKFKKFVNPIPTVQRRSDSNVAENLLIATGFNKRGFTV